eukprot:jgi/Antlo1/868/1979
MRNIFDFDLWHRWRACGQTSWLTCSLCALTSACGAWHSADTRMYAEKRTVPEKKAAVHTEGRDAKSMRVLRKAKNVRIPK